MKLKLKIENSFEVKVKLILTFKVDYNSETNLLKHKQKHYMIRNILTS